MFCYIITTCHLQHEVYLKETTFSVCATVSPEHVAHLFPTIMKLKYTILVAEAKPRNAF